MPDINRELFTRAASTLREEVGGNNIEKSVVKLARMRGVSPRALEALRPDDIGNAAVWSKTYTENSSSRLLDKAGNVLFETEAPLSNQEMELIEQLGLRRR